MKPDGPDRSRESAVSLVVVVFWIALSGSVFLTLIARRAQLLPGEVSTMQWVGSHLSGSLGVAGPVLDAAFTGLMPPLLFVVLIVVTGPSRLIEGDHWPADVIAGYIIAIAGLAAVIWIDRRLPVALVERTPRVHHWLHLDR